MRAGITESGPKAKQDGKLQGSAKLDREIQAELKWMRDPLKLADNIRGLLREDEFEHAQQLVRAASKNVRCTVSWNHLINYQLSRNASSAAVKTYNEVCHPVSTGTIMQSAYVSLQMKKRAQHPDAFTYTILFKGLATQDSNPKALENALSIYQSMSADNSRIKPNVIHTNAMLMVCARAGDMNALFGIAANLPMSGFRAANTLTFTIILNALRQNAVSDASGRLTEKERGRLAAKAVRDGRRVWDDIVGRWRKGDIWIDEALACTMGRLLLVGIKGDWKDIFALLEQSTQLPRLRNDDHFQKALPASQVMEEETSTDVATETTDLVTAESDLTIVNAESDLTPGNEFALVRPPIPVNGTNAYATPGQNTLSLILEACTKLQAKALATYYWGLLTSDPYGIVPDAACYHSYLRILRIARASTEATALVQSMPRRDLGVRTFRIAMPTCMRDKLNPNALANASKLMDKMQTELPLPDLVVMTDYLNLALISPAYSQNGTASLSSQEVKTKHGAQIMKALDRLGPHNVDLKQYLESPVKGPKGEDYRDLATALARLMISALDKIVHQGLVDRSFHGELMQRRSKLAAKVTKYQRQEQASTVSAGSGQPYKFGRKQARMPVSDRKEELSTHPSAV